MTRGTDRARTVMSGRYMTPRAKPLSTKVWCSGCGTSYSLETDRLFLEGFTCDCGRLALEPRFKATTDPLPEEVFTPKRNGRPPVSKRRPGSRGSFPRV